MHCTCWRIWGLKVVINGKGKVKGQSVEVGKQLVKGMVVYIELS